MSFHYYLVDKTKKLLIDVGNHIDESGFEDDYTSYTAFKDFLSNVENSDDELDELEFRKITMAQIAIFMTYRHHIIAMSCCNSRWQALDYKYCHEKDDLDFISETDLDNQKYRDYRVIGG